MAVAKAKSGQELKKEAGKAKRKLKKHLGFDTPYEDVLKWQSEGHELYFDETGEEFLELTSEQVKELSPIHQMRYRMSKQIFDGTFDMDSTVSATLGYDKDMYAKRPGSASDKLKVWGKDEGWDYTFVREDSRARFEMDGWIPDTSPKTKTCETKNDACATTHIGGHRNSEMTLYKIPSDVNANKKKLRKDIRLGKLKKSQDTARESILRAGAKLLSE